MHNVWRNPHRPHPRIPVAEKPRHAAYLRLYAGQPDPTDPTRFTIPFEIGGHKDVLDGRLLDDDTIHFRPRNHEHMLNPG